MTPGARGSGREAAVNTTKHHLGSFLRLLGGLWIALLAVVPSAGASTRWATLEAIRNLENPRNVSRPGPRGELGAYQFRAVTWRMHTTIPFQQAVDRETSERSRCGTTVDQARPGAARKPRRRIYRAGVEWGSRPRCQRHRGPHTATPRRAGESPRGAVLGGASTPWAEAAVAQHSEG